MRLVNRIYREQRELWSKEGIVVILRPITCFASIIAHTPPLPPGKRLIFQRETLDKFISSMLWICSTWLRFEYFNAASGVIGRFATWNLCSRENLLDITVEDFVLSNKDSTMADPIREIRDCGNPSVRWMERLDETLVWRRILWAHFQLYPLWLASGCEIYGHHSTLLFADTLRSAMDGSC